MAIRMTKEIMGKNTTHQDDRVLMKLLFETIGVQNDIEHIY
jgi:hypothetical protein